MHWCNVLLVRKLFHRLWKREDGEAATDVRSEDERRSWAIAVDFGCLLFLSSPLNIGTVTYIYARSELLSSLFGLCMLNLLFSHASRSRLSSLLLLLLLILLYVFSLASKQTALVLSSPLLFICSAHAGTQVYPLVWTMLKATVGEREAAVVICAEDDGNRNVDTMR